MARGAPGEKRLGYSLGPNELILSGTFQKKVITFNYNFPGYLYATAPNADPATNYLQKNQLCYRERTAPGLYAPLLLILNSDYTSGDPSIEVVNADKNKLGIGSSALLHFYDNSASVWASDTNDRNRYVSTIGADDSGNSGSGYAELTINGTFTTTPEDGVDCFCAGIDAGVVDFANYVIVDQEIDLRSAAKPSAIAENFALNAVYA
ncbi:hypothetical protein LCGC14_3127330, partial [marine sediment metagenome]